jgi:hypothetical protein
MDQALVDVFEQARKVVAEEDRKIAEEEERRREFEREKVPGDNDAWTLEVVEDGREPQVLGEFKGGLKAEQASRRLAAARIVTAVGNWVQNVKGSNGNIQNGNIRNGVGSQANTNTKQQPARWQQERDETRPEPTYGTMGKFLGC